MVVLGRPMNEWTVTEWLEVLDEKEKVTRMLVSTIKSILRICSIEYERLKGIQWETE